MVADFDNQNISKLANPQTHRHKTKDTRDRENIQISKFPQFQTVSAEIDANTILYLNKSISFQLNNYPCIVVFFGARVVYNLITYAPRHGLKNQHTE